MENDGLKITVIGAALIVVALIAAILLLRQFTENNKQSIPPKM